MMKTRWFILFFLIFTNGCVVVGTDNTHKEEIIKFVDAHIDKIIKRYFLSAYQDYYIAFRHSVSYEQFKETFENQLDKIYGKLKSARFKTISLGKRITIGKVFNIVTLFYSTEIDKQNTFIKVDVIQEEKGIYLLGYYYINFAMNTVPLELK